MFYYIPCNQKDGNIIEVMEKFMRITYQQFTLDLKGLRTSF